MCKPKSVKLSDRQIEKHVRENDLEHMAEMEHLVRLRGIKMHSESVSYLVR